MWLKLCKGHVLHRYCDEEGVSMTPLIDVTCRVRYSSIDTGNPSNAETTFVQRQGCKIFENHLNPVILVFIGKLSLIALR